jgi:SAM-dependent methyltransferase
MINEKPTTMVESARTDRGKCPFCSDPRAQAWLGAPDRFNGRRKQYLLLRCPACSLVWVQDPPTKMEMGAHYGPDYDRTISLATKAPNHWFRRRDELLRLKPTGGTVLDLGCASGGFLGTLKEHPWRLFGIEMSENAAAVARNHSGAEIFVGDILDASFPSESFDAITCFNVFEHLYEPVKVLGKIAEWLKPDGIFYTIMPNIDSAGSYMFKSYWYALELPRHLYHFSPNTLNLIAASVGLQEASIKLRRELFFEPSVGYIKDDVLLKLGIKCAPPALAEEPRLAWKIVRKGIRLTVLPLISAAAALVGDGEMIEAVFKKNYRSEMVAKH